MSKTITGTFQHPDGTPAAGCTLTLQLSQDASVAGVGQVAHVPVVITLDDTGSIPADTVIFANDELLPAGTFYLCSVHDTDLGQIYAEHLVISGDSPINLDSIAPALR